jgi:CAAX prenyl protease-like protein
MAGLLLMLAVGESLGLGIWEYPLRVVLLAGLLWVFSRGRFDLRPRQSVASVVVGIGVFVIWVAPEVIWPGYRQSWLFNNALTGQAISSVPEAWRGIPLVIVSRAIRAIVLVPIIEELFWRGWLMRWLVDTHFERVGLGTYTRYAFWTSAVLFASVHGAYWEVGLVAGVIYNWWMVKTRSLGDCILAHAVTNAILATYVVSKGEWQYW